MPPRKNKKAAARKAARRGPPRAMSAPQTSTMSETVSVLTPILPNVATYWTVTLASFGRAIQMSKLFEFFRIEEVEYTYRPLYSQFDSPFDTGTVVSTVPNLYRMMDRGRQYKSALCNKDEFDAVGAKPFQFTRPYKVKYRPNTLSVQQAAVTTDAVPVILTSNKVDYGAWLPCFDQNVAAAGGTNPNTLLSLTVPYYGHWVYAEQIRCQDAAEPVYTCDVTIRVSFKNPLRNIQAGDQAPVPLNIKVGVKEDGFRTSAGTLGGTLIE